MTHQSRIPTTSDRPMSPGQAATLRKAEAGRRLSDFERGHLRAVEAYGTPADSRRAAAALDADQSRRTGRRRA